MHPPVTITTVHPLKDVTDCLLKLGMLISCSEALLVIVKRRPGKTCRSKQILQPVV
ncbi:hypothetical protein CEPID_04330 [Corynebacterium epidermidicanis]|uniref:Uncharacterized protein n=1 Tax=Corynebacterium epidermidicanis TaxID=1050174 RepID=A0A0G3GT85_9CORY|nr:hypothetical protein CEPID_04330 [Corynebacterium epidermidicanis]